MFNCLPGFRDFYPVDCSLRNHFFRVWRQTASRYGFLEYDTPVLESLDLFRAKSGDEIASQLFAFTDKGGREVALRPETTPGLARMVGAKANSLKRPVKWFTIGEQYRYERAQRGRLRAFYQFNADILGESGPGAEIELLALLINSLTAFGLGSRDFYIRLSDRDLWMLYLQGCGLDRRATALTLAVIDKIGRDSDSATNEKLEAVPGGRAGELRQKIEILRCIKKLEDLETVLLAEAGEGEARAAVEARLADWRSVLNGLDAMGLGSFVEMDLGVVRGLAYYTGFVFEAFDRGGTFRALAGGGRYNDLVGKLGRAELPAVGFAIGDVVLSELLAEKKLLPSLVSSPDIQMILGGSAERRVAMADLMLLREAGYRVEYPLKESSFGKQFKSAGQSGARLALIYGEEEVGQRSVKIRDLREGTETLVPRQQLLPRVAAAFQSG